MRSNTIYPAQEPPVCPYCSEKTELRDNSFVYGPGRFSGNIWICIPCDAYVGCHKGGSGVAPVGSPAKKSRRDARKRAHHTFDPLWKSGLMTRRDAYRFIREGMNLSKDEAHIGLFTEEQCEQLITLIHIHHNNTTNATARF